MNEIYASLIDKIYNTFPTLEELIDKIGPEKLYSKIKPNVPYLNEMFYGFAYVPYIYGVSAAANIFTRIKDEDMDKNIEKKLNKISYVFGSIIAPFVEELLFRFLPAVTGKYAWKFG